MLDVPRELITACEEASLVGARAGHSRPFSVLKTERSFNHSSNKCCLAIPLTELLLASGKCQPANFYGFEANQSSGTRF